MRPIVSAFGLVTSRLVVWLGVMRFSGVLAIGPGWLKLNVLLVVFLMVVAM